ncbi:phosphotransferase system eiib component type 2/3 [Trichococcus palustris]|uniref:Phosphotransferase system eiib component type 2/3 n=1 Tax=Trichococcus palustris TaxID=140314 RepID=A0A143YK74_9LACT|nr:PTS sugar transporter subunit IIB [Trichococcus palustris]CZQ90967.1 phosphotransferase system eiib component type 2/3 [Trichococcus palustris]
MAEKTIMLVCAAGMSTSLLVSKMQKAAAAQGVEAEIFAVGAGEADAQLAKKSIDVLLLGPQVKYMRKQFEDKLAGTSTKMDVINMQDYGMMNGEKVLKTALDLIGQ